MDFVQAVRTCLSDYATFTGRASRSEYWWFVLFTSLFDFAAQLVDRGIGVRILGPLSGLVFLLPILAVSVRRMHDLDRSGWWVLIGLVPVIGWIVLLIWQCRRGSPGPNRFGFPRIATI